MWYYYFSKKSGLSGSKSRKPRFLSSSFQLFYHFAPIHRLHELFGEGFGAGSFFGVEGTHRLKMEDGIGLASPAGGFLQGDPGDHAVERGQGAGEPGGVFEEQPLAGHWNPNQQGQHVARPQQEQQHRFLTGLGPGLPVLGAVVVERTVGAGLAVL